MSAPNPFDNVQWSILEKENPALYTQVKPHINRLGKVTSLPINIEVDVLRWISEQHAKQRAAAAVAKVKADEVARLKARDERKRAEFQERYGKDVAQAHAYAGLQRILQYSQERGLAPEPSNAKLITEWCANQPDGLTEANVDKAIVALSSQLLWSDFASRLRA